MNRQIKITVIALLLAVTIGFAAITATLSFTGNVNINGSYDNFANNVTFTDVAMDETSKTAGATATVTNSGKSVTFTTQTLDMLNETATLTYKIKNDSQYNALLGAINCTSEDPDYVEVTRGNVLNNVLVEKGETSEVDSVTVKLIKTYSDVTPRKITITCKLNATAQAAED